MDPRHQTHTKTPSKTYRATISPRRRRWSTVGVQRKKLPVVHLGGRKPPRGQFILRMLRRIRVRWSKLQYRSKLRKLKEWYTQFVRDFIEGGASFEAFQQRLFMESTFGVPGLGVSVSTFPSLGSSRVLYF